MAGLPSVAATFLSRVCIPFNAPFSKAKVSTTRCQGFAGVALSKSSEKRSSFFLAMDSAGTEDRSAAKAAVVMSERAVKMRRVFIRCQVRADVQSLSCPWQAQARRAFQRGKLFVSTPLLIASTE